MSEKKRLKQGDVWKKWGCYVSERAWGTVREDYSATGDAWNYFPHDMARSRAYRWSEDGLAGLCDDQQKLIFALAFWNGKDPILKERLFGLNPYEGNHAEDVKEYYFYLDATPTHSYLKFLYKYPQSEFPYSRLVEENRRRSAKEREFELLDTGVFESGKYYDIVVEYAKAGPEDICIRIEIFNRGPDAAHLHLLPHLWFRNTWSWGQPPSPAPEIRLVDEGALYTGEMYLSGDFGKVYFTENETGRKDAFHRFLIQKENCLNSKQSGSKACFHYELDIPPKSSKVIRLRLSKEKGSLKDVDKIVAALEEEADDFYETVHPKGLSIEEKMIQRQALAGMLFSKQFYNYDLKQWFSGDNPKEPPPPSRYKVRNNHWHLLRACDVISMPDKWEYPWFASWDLAFQTIALSLVDLELAKKQLLLLLTINYQHQSGQIPAYEWSFSDLNPPVQAWALWKLYQKDSDREFLETVFLKLMRNFTWWDNKVYRTGNNFFEGGFLGLDNISVIDRSKPLADGGHIEQSDGTGWMGFYSLFMMRCALELAKEDSVYEKVAIVFFEEFLLIASAMEDAGCPFCRSVNMWDEKDGFFYDVISYPDGRHEKMKIRSFVGLIPFFSLDDLTDKELELFPHFRESLQTFVKNHPLKAKRALTRLDDRYLLSLMPLDQIKQVLQKAFDPQEFYSPYGLRSLSKFHEKNPWSFEGSSVGYEPGESLERIKGGNSNWRGPLWIPINYLFIGSLRRLSEATDDPSYVKKADELSGRLTALFKKDPSGNRPVHGDYKLFQKDPHWKDLLLFYEHYHGDTGRGLGASHQTGWSGLVANLF